MYKLKTFFTSSLIATYLVILSPTVANAAAIVSPSPNGISLSVGQTVNINLNINPNGANVGAATINYNFDPAVFSYVSFTPSTYNLCVSSSVSSGKVTQSCGVAGGTKSSANFGTLVLKALKSADAKVSISGEILDENSNNQFTSAVTASYKVGAVQGTQTGSVKSAKVTVSPSVSPTPTPEVTSEPTSTISFSDQPEPETKLKCLSWLQVTTALVVLALLGYFIYRKRWLDKFFKRKVS